CSLPISDCARRKTRRYESLSMSFAVMQDSVSQADAKKTFQAYGAALELMESQEAEVLICGAAGTGKSHACLEKLHKEAQKYIGSRLLICRKTRESLSETGLVTYEQKVLSANSTIKSGIQRRVRQLYQYPNGSEIVVGGLSLDTRIMSTEF